MHHGVGSSNTSLKLQELERQEDPRQGSPSHTTAAVMSADTVTQGSCGNASASVMMSDVGAEMKMRQSQQVNRCQLQIPIALHTWEPVT